MSMYVDTIFRLCNFAVVIAVVVYVVRKHGILLVMSMMRVQREELLQRADQYKLLNQECDDIAQRTQEQEDDFRAMQKKFVLWEQQVEKSLQKEEAILQERKVDLELKQVRKLQSLRQRRLVKHSLPKLMHEVEQDLQQTFNESSDQGQAYTKQLLKFLEE